MNCRICGPDLRGDGVADFDRTAFDDLRAQTAAVAGAYARVGLVTAEQAARAGVEDAAARSKTFRAMDPEGVELEHAFVSRAAIAQLDAAVVEALAECGWCEAEALMPPDLPAADAPAMLARTPVAVAAAFFSAASLAAVDPEWSSE